mgnify:CR=1 FL=1
MTLLAAEPTWVRFAIVSLFLQWCALGSAGLLCLARRLFERMSLVAGGFLAWGLVVGVVALFTTIGELGISGAGAAVLNAIHDATGIRVRNYPATLDQILTRLPA